MGFHCVPTSTPKTGEFPYCTVRELWSSLSELDQSDKIAISASNYKFIRVDFPGRNTQHSTYVKEEADWNSVVFLSNSDVDSTVEQVSDVLAKWIRDHGDAIVTVNKTNDDTARLFELEKKWLPKENRGVYYATALNPYNVDEVLVRELNKECAVLEVARAMIEEKTSLLPCIIYRIDGTWFTERQLKYEYPRMELEPDWKELFEEKTAGDVLIRDCKVWQEKLYVFTRDYSVVRAVLTK